MMGILLSTTKNNNNYMNPHLRNPRKSASSALCLVGPPHIETPCFRDPKGYLWRLGFGVRVRSVYQRRLSRRWFRVQCMILATWNYTGVSASRSSAGMSYMGVCFWESTVTCTVSRGTFIWGTITTYSDTCRPKPLNPKPKTLNRIKGAVELTICA